MALIYVPDSSLEVGKPARSVDIIAIKDSVINLMNSNYCLHATDALRQSGDTIYIAKSDGTLESVAVVGTSSSRALASDALRISGPSIWLVKADGSSETINIGQIAKSLGIGVIGSAAFLKNRTLNTITPGQNIDGSSLDWSDSNGTQGSPPAGTWMCRGYVLGGNSTEFLRIS